jgi:hypothetical protein
MTTITPRLDNTVTGVPRVIWEEAATGDTMNPLTVTQQYGLAASVQVVGTFGGATVSLQVSNDGVNWDLARDVLGNAISLTTTGYFEFSLSAAYIRPAISGGSGNDVDVILVLRGGHGV